MATLIADAGLTPLARVATTGHGYCYGAVTMPVGMLMGDACLAASARAAFIGHGYSYGTVKTPMATWIADARLAPLARAAIVGLDIATEMATPLATLLAEGWLRWPVLRLCALDTATALSQRLWPR